MKIPVLVLSIALASASCRSTESASVKDVLLYSKAGAMLFYREGSNIMIKACKEPVAITSVDKAGSACELKEGTKIQTVSVDDFRKDLNQGLKLQVSDPKTQSAVDKIGKEEQAKSQELAEQQQAFEKAQLKEDITAIRQMLNANGGANDPKKVASLNRVLAQLEASLARDVKITPKDVDPVNAAVTRLIDDMISKPGVIILNTNSGADLFFALLESYITKEQVISDTSPNRFEMITIQPGKFKMGSPTNEANRYSDEALHEVTLTRGFMMSKYEITQGQWKAVMGENPSRFKGSDDLPVEMVSWNDAQAFISKLNNGTARCGDTSTAAGFKKAWSTPGCYRLATEAEWEYAARAGTTTPYYTGQNITKAQANYDGSRTVSVKDLDSANPWGLKHMSGNVWEWVQDWHAEKYDLENTIDPVGPVSGSDRVFRGGSWNSDAGTLRSANRYRVSADYRYNNFGLRLVRTLP